jgi:hypothetical protein
MRSSLIAGLVLLPGIASAHIHLTFPTPRTDVPTGDQKIEHCGTPNWVRAQHPDRTSTFLPGQTITVTWLETINHPGYYRVAFQPNGETFRIPPAGNGPPAGFPDENLTGQTDPGGTGSLILADRVADGTLSAQITFPNMECANCTLQLIQVMTDKAPYTVDANSDDLYFKCADITLSASAPDAGPQPTVDAGADPDAGNGNNGGGAEGGGCSTGAGAGLAVAAMLAGLRRRRR